ncbi:MAG: ribosome silencing factor [Bacilli bacterium]
MKPLVQTIVEACDSKKANEIVALKLEGISAIADYFVICHGNSDKQSQAIAREVKEKVQEAGFEVKRFEGFDDARWILVDTGDVVVHVFTKDERGYYNLEKLWGDVPRLELDFLGEEV